MVAFQGDVVVLRVGEHFVPQAVQMFKQFCESANQAYISQIQKEHRDSLLQRRNELERQIKELERLFENFQL